MDIQFIFRKILFYLNSKQYDMLCHFAEISILNKEFDELIVSNLLKLRGNLQFWSDLAKLGQVVYHAKTTGRVSKS